MKRHLAGLFALILPAVAAAENTAPAAPAAGSELRYRYDTAADSPLLKDYDGESWWRMLANCAGYAVVAAEQPGLPPESVAGYQKDSNYYATLASYRLARDQGRALGIQPEVESVANQAADNVAANGMLATPEQRRSMAILCDAHVKAYERMVPGRGLK